jgi:hypothetical protein
VSNGPPLKSALSFTGHVRRGRSSDPDQYPIANFHHDRRNQRGPPEAARM